MSSESLLKYLADRKKLNESSRAILAKRYRQNQQLLFPNAETLETLTGAEIDEINYYMPTPSIIKSVIQTQGTNNEETRKNTALTNLKTIITPSEADEIIDLFTDDEIKILNSQFPKIKTEIATTSFTNLNDLADFILAFIQKVIDKKPKITADDRQNANSQSTVLKQRSSFLIDVNAKLGDLINFINGIDRANATSGDIRGIVNYAYDIFKLLSLPQQDVKTYLTARASELRRRQPHGPYQRNFKSPIPSNQTQAFYTDLVGVYEDELITNGYLQNKIDDWEAGEVVKYGYGLKQSKKQDLVRKPKRRGLKFVGYGKAIPKIEDVDKINHFLKGHLYIDMNKMNDNILAIKYVKTGNKKNEVQITDNTKAVLIQLINNKFNASSYEKLNENEKKIISFVNHIFKLVSKDILSNEPIEELYNKYQILKGQIEAGNNNPLILKNLKQILFELHKFKKINSAQLRNIIFELSNID